MIPPILHQTWKTRDLPENLAKFRRSIAKRNPKLDMRLYDDAASRKLIEDHCPELLPAYDRLPFGVAKSDLFRLAAVYAEGGFYADLDMECVRSLEPFRRTTKAVFSIEAEVMPQRQQELGYEQPFQLANCMFGAPPRHPFIRDVIRQIDKGLAARTPKDHSEIEDATGPRVLTRLFYELKPRNVGVLEQVYWVPPDLYAAVPLLARRIHFRHHFAGTWKTSRGKQPLKRQFIERNRLPNPYPSGLWRDFGWG
jgi:inositol phosphorylceramide mannosyltransferase catalytic subunit